MEADKIRATGAATERQPGHRSGRTPTMLTALMLTALMLTVLMLTGWSRSAVVALPIFITLNRCAGERAEGRCKAVVSLTPPDRAQHDQGDQGDHTPGMIMLMFMLPATRLQPPARLWR